MRTGRAFLFVLCDDGRKLQYEYLTEREVQERNTALRSEGSPYRWVRVMDEPPPLGG